MLCSSCRQVAHRVFASEILRAVAFIPGGLSSRHYSNDGTNAMVGRDFLSLKDFTSEEIKQLLWTAKDLKTRIKDNKEIFNPLKGTSLAMLFQKRSTRTRLSTETGMALLGGHPVFMAAEDIHLGVKESIKDSARVLSRLADVVLARVVSQEDIDALAEDATIPVINGLSDLYHPLQTLADFLTLQEHFGYLRGLKIAWIGDGNNVAHSLMIGCAKLGIDFSIATPKGYEPDAKITEYMVKMAAKNETDFRMTTNPEEAVYRADAIFTDVWVSMGQEQEKKERLAQFSGYKINRKMLKEAGANWVFMHCLPRTQEEVTDDIFYDSERSIVWQEAENRKWTVMSVLLHLLKGYSPVNPRPKFLRGE